MLRNSVWSPECFLQFIAMYIFALRLDVLLEEVFYSFHYLRAIFFPPSTSAIISNTTMGLLSGAYTPGVLGVQLSLTDRDVTFSRWCDLGKITKKAQKFNMDVSLLFWAKFQNCPISTCLIQLTFQASPVSHFVFWSGKRTCARNKSNSNQHTYLDLFELRH